MTLQDKPKPYCKLASKLEGLKVEAKYSFSNLNLSQPKIQLSLGFLKILDAFERNG